MPRGAKVLWWKISLVSSLCLLVVDPANCLSTVTTTLGVLVPLVLMVTIH